MSKIKPIQQLPQTSTDVMLSNDYDILQDELFERLSNKKRPDHLDAPTGSIATFTGSFGKAEAKHLLNRTLYGYSKSTLDSFSNKSLIDAVTDLLNVNTAYSSEPKDHQARSATYGQEWVNLPYDGTKNGPYRTSLAYWLCGNIVNQEDNILEKMTMFWHNHFAVEFVVVGRPRACYDYFKLLRENALGNFKTLATKITTNPAMLRYLNGIYNTKNSPDENYAREVMELFTLGKDENSQYTEDDVIAAARVLTGWKNQTDWRDSEFKSWAHDTDDKVFSSFFNNTVITGKTGTAGADETQELIDMIFTKEDVIARYMVEEFYKYFIYYNITPDIRTNIIIPLADEFKKDWEIKPLLRALLTSTHFYDNLNRGCFIKTPFDLYGNMARTFNAYHPNDTVEKEYLSYQFTYFFTGLMGMGLGAPPNVSGWPAFYQIPKFHEMWINSDTYPKRIQYCVYLGLAGHRVKDELLKIDLLSYAEGFGADAADPNKLVNLSCEYLLGVDLSQTSKDKLKTDALLSGIPMDSIWTDSWNAYLADKTDINKTNTVLFRVASMFQVIFELPEFQLH